MKRLLLFAGLTLAAATGSAALRFAVPKPASAGHALALAPASLSTTSAPPGDFSPGVIVTRTSSSARRGAGELRNPESARLEQRRVLFETVDALLEVSRFTDARELLDADRRRSGDSPKPWRDLEQSYRLLADCLEHHDSGSQARAQAFLRGSEARVLAPRLRAACSSSATSRTR